MTAKETNIEVAAISAVISNTIFNKAYEFFNNNGMGGYIFTTYEIAAWAVEFEELHRNTNWEQVLENGFKNLSQEFKQQIICWDDAVMDFAHHKFEEFVKKVS